MLPSPSSRRRRALGAIGVCIVAFASIAGGPYGIEAAVGAAGALPTLLGLVAAALIWSSPQALVTAELSAAFPFNAGYVGWVLRGLGPVAGFVNAWSMMIAQSLNLPLYPVLIADYAQQLEPSLSQGALWAIKLAVLAAAVTTNVLGVQAVEFVSLIMVLLVQTPFLLMPIVSAAHGGSFDWSALSRLGAPGSLDIGGGSFSVFASCICWNMQGWVTLGSIAGEVRSARRDYPRGLLVAVVLVSINYLYPVAIGIAMAPDSSAWDTGYFVTIASGVAPWLGTYATLMAVLSSMANLVPQMTTSARSMAAAARLGIVPAPLLGLESVTRLRTPVPAILTIAALTAVLMTLSFDILVVIQLLFSGVGLALQFASFIYLKHTQPRLRRPYAVPFGAVGAWLLALPFFCLLGLIFVSTCVETPELAGVAAGITALLVAGGVAWTRYGQGAAASASDYGTVEEVENEDGEDATGNGSEGPAGELADGSEASEAQRLLAGSGSSGSGGEDVR